MERIGRAIAQRSGLVIAIVLVATALFAGAILTIEPNTTEESFNSDTEIHRALERVESNFQPSTHGVPVVIEAKSGNVLTIETVREIAGALQAVETDPIVAPMIVEFYDPNLLMNVSSITALPTSVQYIMDGASPLGYQIGYHNRSRPGNDLANATDADLNSLLDYLFQVEDKSGTMIYREFVSHELEKRDGAWSAPVIMVFIAVDRERMEENYTFTQNGGADADTSYFEEFDLHVMDILKGKIRSCNVYGVGVGVEDEIEREIEASGPFMVFTFIVIIVILIIIFRKDRRSFLAAAIGLPMIIVWMIGSARLLNLADTQFTAFLPVLIMALGIDYAIHAMRRYDEELATGKTPRAAVGSSIAKLGGTLALAMVTTMIAFLSNLISTIPALHDWGIEAGIAIGWTFVIMGFFVPALRLAFERKTARDTRPRQGPNPERETGGDHGSGQTDAAPGSRVGTALAKVSFWSITHPAIVIAILVALVVPLGYGAMNLDSDFELKEFFIPESDFVVGLDIYTEHFPSGGEPNILLIEGEIATPAVLTAIAQTRVKYEQRGYATYYSWDLTQIVQNYTQNGVANALVSGAPIVVTDTNNDSIPDETAQIDAILTHATTVGLWGMVNGTVTMYLRPDLVREIVHYNEDDGQFDKTVMYVGVAGSGALAAIKSGMDAMEEDAAVINQAGDVSIVVTGSGPERWEQLNAISGSMVRSIQISIILCLTFLIFIFRRPGFSLVAVFPVLLIAVWLYGIMFWTGYHLNIVTATIGAMSIGVGVDYSIHVCDRYRKERFLGRSFDEAMETTITHTGAALLFSALTTSFGFFVMLFAPMPMFFSFGLLSGMMVIFAFIASVIVVPPVLKFVDRKRIYRNRTKPDPEQVEE